MQPPVFQFVPPPLAPKPKKVRPAILTVMLGLKGASDLFIVGLGVLTYVSLGSQSDVTIPRAYAQHLANVLLLGIVLSFLELFGVVGTFSFKRWGVYLVIGFSALNVMAQLSAGNRFMGMISFATTAIIAAAIYPRWNDYE